MKSCLTKDPTGHGSIYKEVRFSPTVTPSQSIFSDIPAMNPSSTLDADYLDQLRSLLAHQRANFESERAGERQLWETERALLKSRISELEACLSGNRRDRGAVHHYHYHHPSADKNSDAVPNNNSSQVWEGSSPGGQPTRVFHEEGKSLDECLGSSSLSLDEALSPQFRATDAVPVPVPIEKLDSKLDGITLKSSALPPEVVARVMTPPSPSPSTSPAPASQETSPSVAPQKPVEHKHTLKLKLAELGPPDKNLTRDAGHTPMAAVVDATPNGGDANEADEEEKGVGHPTEQSDSYFPDLPEDPALKGPLSLLNEEEHDRGFLKELNQKLLHETRQAPFSPSSDNPSGQEKDVETPSRGDQDLELKFKNTTNFGTAFGESNCGKC